MKTQRTPLELVDKLIRLRVKTPSGCWEYTGRTDTVVNAV